MRPKTVEPEIIPPGRASVREGALSDEALAGLASLLDDMFHIPGTAIRFGIDPLIGLVPGLGDLISSMASLIIVYAAWQRGLPRVTVGRMMANIAIDTVVGAVPFLGDAFDVAWKSNRKNLTLLQRSSQFGPHRQNWRDWLFLGAVALVALLLMSVPLAVLWVIARILHF